jgi:hypothetical protein
VETAARLSVAALNRALLDELLPAGRGQRTVLLDCDDQALAAATARFGATEAPDVVLGRALHAAGPISSHQGLRAVLRALREPPEDLIVLCACVLAASRMAADELHHTQAYYVRLCEVLGIEPRDQHPAVAGFERIPERFRALERWAAAEGRGRLALPAEPAPALVGMPISQTMLRRVDRVRLGTLFDRHRIALDLGRDPLRLLRASSLRFQLTSPAQRLLERDDLDEPLRLALEAAYNAWDGTVTDEHGRRLTATTLRLAYTPGRVTLNVSLPDLAADTTLTGPDGATSVLPAWPGELVVPAGWLTYAIDGAVTADMDDGRTLRALPGPTMLFDVTDTGFWRISAANGDGRVILLTADSDLLARDWGPRRASVPLPHGWGLVFDVDADELPEELREPAHDDEPGTGGDIELTGGLQLERGVWLLDHPPDLRSRLAEPVVVEARAADGEWRQLGEIQPYEHFKLAAVAHTPGTHTIAVSGHEFTVELAERGLRAGAGAFCHHPRDPYLMRAGAVSRSDAETYGDPPPMICGASINGAGLPGWRAPLTTRAQAPIHVIYEDGRVAVAGPGQQPQWARQAQLPPGGSWPIPDGEHAVWLCVQSRTHPRVIAVKDEAVPMTDEVLDTADLFADAPVIDNGHPAAPARWEELVQAARADEEVEAHG